MINTYVSFLVAEDLQTQDWFNLDFDVRFFYDERSIRSIWPTHMQQSWELA